MATGPTQRLAKLDTKESYFLDLAGEEGWRKTGSERRPALFIRSPSFPTHEIEDSE